MGVYEGLYVGYGGDGYNVWACKDNITLGELLWGWVMCGRV